MNNVSENIFKLNSFTKKTTFLDKYLKSINEGKKIKLRAQVKEKSFHLYLDYHFQNKREKQYLRIYVNNKRTPETLKKLQEAILLRDRKEIQLFGMSEPEEFRLNKEKYKANFIDYFEFLAINRKNRDKSWMHSLKHLRIFTENQAITFAMVSKHFSEEFKNYLETNLSQNTAHTYFSKFKTALNHAIQDGILDSVSPAQFITIKKQEVLREFLTLKELQILKGAPCPNEQSKRAFLFACFTGLRISDIKKLTWVNIRGEQLLIRQKKTDSINGLKLHTFPLEILEQQKRDGYQEDKIFDVIPSENKINNHLKIWKEKAGIKKHITFHIARHTFATLLLTFDNDIYTVSKLLGHKDVKVTQIYAKLIDKKKDEAIDKLPSI